MKNKFQNEYSESIIDKVFEDLEVKVFDSSKKEEIIIKETSTKKDIKYSNFDENKIKIGRYVKETFQELVDNNLITNDEIIKLQQESYSKLTFDIQYPFLKKVIDYNTRVLHYWKPIFKIRGENYLVCSEWYENDANNDRPFYESWLKRIKKNHYC